MPSQPAFVANTLAPSGITLWIVAVPESETSTSPFQTVMSFRKATPSITTLPLGAPVAASNIATPSRSAAYSTPSCTARPAGASSPSANLAAATVPSAFSLEI